MLLTKKLVIRAAQEQDISPIQRIFKENAKIERREKRANGLGSPYIQADRDFMQRYATGDDRFQVIVAELDRDVVGYARALHRKDKRKPKSRSEAGEKQTTVHKLGVLPDFHGKGIGSLLMKDIIVKAKALGRQTVRIVLPLGNPLGFYEKLGFRTIAQLPSSSPNKRPLNIIELEL